MVQFGWIGRQPLLSKMAHIVRPQLRVGNFFTFWFKYCAGNCWKFPNERPGVIFLNKYWHFKCIFLKNKITVWCILNVTFRHCKTFIFSCCAWIKFFETTTITGLLSAKNGHLNFYTKLTSGNIAHPENMTVQHNQDRVGRITSPATPAITVEQTNRITVDYLKKGSYLFPLRKINISYVHGCLYIYFRLWRNYIAQWFSLFFKARTFFKGLFLWSCWPSHVCLKLKQ